MVTPGPARASTPPEGDILSFNGLLGGLLWGQGQELRLSLDRGDLWDLRTPETLLRNDWTCATMRRLVAERNQRELVKMFDDPYSAAYPTEVPAGGLEPTRRIPQGIRLRMPAEAGRDTRRTGPLKGSENSLFAEEDQDCSQNAFKVNHAARLLHTSR